MKPLDSLIHDDDTSAASRYLARERELAGMDTDDLARAARSAVGDAVAALEDLALVVGHLVDRDRLAATLVDVRDVKKLAADVYSTVETALVSEAGEKSFDVPSLGRFEVRKKTKRSGWRHDELVPVLVAKANEERRLNTESGEVETEGHAVARVLRACISFGAGKVTGLRERGLQVDEWCNEEDDGYAVMLPAATR